MANISGVLKRALNNKAAGRALTGKQQAAYDAHIFSQKAAQAGQEYGPQLPWGASSSLEGRFSSLEGRSTPLSARPTPGQASTASYSVNPDHGVLRNMASSMGSALTGKYGDGWGIAKQAGRHALRGAVAGGAIGGTTEWAQGGSFWAGAKQGAFNGAVGWSGYRMLGHATGATKLNPFSKQGSFGSAMSQYGNVSKQVKAIAQARSDAAKVLK